MVGGNCRLYVSIANRNPQKSNEITNFENEISRYLEASIHFGKSSQVGE